MLDFWDAIAYCLHEGGRLISPEDALLIDSNEELNQLLGGMYRTSGYWSEYERFWFDAANLDSGSPFSKIMDWSQHIEPTLCKANGGRHRRSYNQEKPL